MAKSTGRKKKMFINRESLLKKRLDGKVYWQKKQNESDTNKILSKKYRKNIIVVYR